MAPGGLRSADPLHCRAQEHEDFPLLVQVGDFAPIRQMGGIQVGNPL
jgi:hypothetical protein